MQARDRLVSDLASGGGVEPPGLAAAEGLPLPVSGEDWASWLRAAVGTGHGAEIPPCLWDALTWLARREGFTVKRTECGAAGSVTTWASRCIEVHAGLDSSAAVWRLLHELAHVLMGGETIYLPGAGTGGCRGAARITADSVAFMVAVRLGMDTATCSWPYVASWAGRDPRARPADIIEAVTARATTAAATIIRHLDVALFGIPPQARAQSQPEVSEAPAGAVRIPAEVRDVLLAAESFYLSQLSRSWVPGYLRTRGLTKTMLARWSIGYAPAGWTNLIGHLRRHGHDDTTMVAAGLARRSRRGTLIDHFRDRVMLTIRDEHGDIAGFIGRAHPDAQPGTPKYLNSPDGLAYKKGDVLFGLYEARSQLAHGATPVLAEGPFDAIAVTVSSPAHYAGLAPCGTAFTHRQAAAIARAADLQQGGVLVALDGDRAGRAGAVKAYEILLPHTQKLTAVVLAEGHDPAGLLQARGAAVLCRALQRTEPLAAVVIDAHLDEWSGGLNYAAGQLGAMRSAAARIARLLPPQIAEGILTITDGHILATLDEHMRPITNLELPAIARILPPAAICQIARTADRTQSDCSDVTVEVANAVALESRRPKGIAAREPGRNPHATTVSSPAATAAAGFPGPGPALAAPHIPDRHNPPNPQRAVGRSIGR